ncbi:MerR family transcriptional regulator [Fictibacillus enclensis]|uniref:MerR family transcriptional regulator n=1 Tax=Fictibacillus enclensis TaxID=1017270 RepID=UPI0024BF1D54|nr:MerR family transcriptional regulator [Fictibacillus enclensis]WHY74757.1 MerR family transcriptional regulator [Fictibacillus enclensis]
MHNRFTIGQMSKLHSIPIKTLRYYDEIGLFKPAHIDSETGYRYYSIDQFELLDIIIYLKTVGVPLKQIKEQLERRILDSFLEVLQQQKEDAAAKIKELELITKRLDYRIAEIERTKTNQPLGQAELKYCKERPIVQIREQVGSLHDLEYSLRRIKKILGLAEIIVIGKVGLTLPISSIKEQRYSDYNSVFLFLESPAENLLQQKEVSFLPEGRYACISYRGNHNDAPMFYEKLTAFMSCHHLKPAGDAIERVIVDEYISGNPDDFFAEIQIPLLN